MIENKQTQNFLHADDFGMNDSISKTILDSIQQGSLNSVSVMMGNSNKYFNDLKKSGVKIKLHLNITSNPKIYNSKNSELMKNLDFFNVLFLNKNVRSSIHDEINFQVNDFVDYFEREEIAIDGHHHIQTIPWIYNYLVNLEDFNIKEIRVSKEKIFLDNIQNLFNKRFYRNLAAVLLLNFISKGINEVTKETPEFYGLLYSGIHNVSTIEKRINKKNNIEISLHPGLIGKEDRATMHWRDFEYYFTEYRKIDYLIANSEELKRFI